MSRTYRQKPEKVYKYNRHADFREAVVDAHDGYSVRSRHRKSHYTSAWDDVARGVWDVNWLDGKRKGY